MYARSWVWSKGMERRGCWQVPADGVGLLVAAGGRVVERIGRGGSGEARVGVKDAG
jgi:hypothetical protein